MRSETPVPPTDTPVPTSTPVPTATPIPRVEAEDPAEDGFNCINGDPSTTALPAVVDVTNAWVELDLENQAYLFSLEFGRAEQLDEPFVGGVHIYDAAATPAHPFDSAWYFNNTTNWSQNFFFTPPDEFELFLAVVEENGR